MPPDVSGQLLFHESIARHLEIFPWVSASAAGSGQDSTPSLDSTSLPNILSIALGLIGAVGVIWTFLAWREQQRTNEAYRQILEEAAVDRKATYTKDQLQELQQERAKLTEMIRVEVPLETERQMLRQQREVVVNAIQERVREYERLADRLELIGEAKEPLPDRVSSAITALVKSPPPDQARRRRVGTAAYLVILGSALWLLRGDVDYWIWRVSGQSLGVTGGDVFAFVLVATATYVVAILIVDLAPEGRLKAHITKRATAAIAGAVGVILILLGTVLWITKGYAAVEWVMLINACSAAAFGFALAVQTQRKRSA